MTSFIYLQKIFKALNIYFLFSYIYKTHLCICWCIDIQNTQLLFYLIFSYHIKIIISFTHISLKHNFVSNFFTASTHWVWKFTLCPHTHIPTSLVFFPLLLRQFSATNSGFVVFPWLFLSFWHSFSIFRSPTGFFLFSRLLLSSSSRSCYFRQPTRAFEVFISPKISHHSRSSSHRNLFWQRTTPGFVSDASTDNSWFRFRHAFQ